MGNAECGILTAEDAEIAEGDLTGIDRIIKIGDSRTYKTCHSDRSVR